jgi:GNAT superfamily N-acetyltransferase
VSALGIRPIRIDDAGEVLTLQRAAFVQEAQVYGSPDTPPLTQTLEELRAELAENLGVVALREGRIVGALRARADGGMLLIGRIAVAPDQQGAGVGSALLEAAEARGRDAGCREAELFTGSLSTPNIELYEHLGYVESERVPTAPGFAEVYLRKPLA